MAQAVRVRVSLEAPIIMKNEVTHKVRFDDETQTIHVTVRGTHNGKATAVRFEKQIKSKREYFKRKLIGK